MTRSELFAACDLLERCYGCQACAVACPTGAVRMEENAEGFGYPVATGEACSGCGACGAVCPAFSGADLSLPLRYIACRNKDESIRRVSSSGGVFPTLAQAVLRRGGVVYGATLREGDGQVRHMDIERADQIPLLQGSKYVQSHLGTIPEKMLRALDKRTVLFTGTPCQVAGMKRVAGSAGRNLVTMEVICYGVGSPGLFRKYLAHLAAQGGAVRAFRFRDKHTGWLTSSVSYVHGGAVRRESLGVNPYTSMYFRNLCLRPSCHTCVFAGNKRTADISVGDFKKIGEYFPDMDDGLGTSVVLLNSPMGQALWEEIKEGFVWREVAGEQAEQPRLRLPTEKNPERITFMRDMAQVAFPELQKSYAAVGTPAARMLQLRKRLKEKNV